MNTIKDFIWFTTHSWSYMQGDRKNFVTGFWPVWKVYHRLCEVDRATQEKIGGEVE